MKIAIASGKGGTGKTMVATSLAATLAPDYKINLIDCDVEAPNTHLFLKLDFTEVSPAVLQIPEIKSEICVLCGKCVDVCQYHALAKIINQILVLPQLCHGCGSCTRICPVNAISETAKEIGTLHRGKTTAGIQLDMGVLAIGEAMPSPIIHQLKALNRDVTGITILDSPPGASCAVVATIHDADFVLLVTEPTPFGLHDLKQMLGIISKTGSPAGIIINRDGLGDGQLETFISETAFPIMMRIPYKVEIASGLGSGQLLIDIIPPIKREFLTLFEKITEAVSNHQGKS